jgi:isopentenyl-diphosphate delta-isomerase
MAKGEPNSEYTLHEESLESSLTRRRKIEHIEICLDEDVQSRYSTMFEDIYLIHNALPELNKDNIDLTTNLLGLRASAPIVIAGMTGGHPKTFDINKRLAEAAEELRIAIGVGSQRAAIEDASLMDTFKIVRDTAPSVPVIANIGATHTRYASEAIEMIDADALAIHLNPLQEAIQPEGDCDSEGIVNNIATIVDSVDIPVIVKETGAGISAEVAGILENIGVDGIDIGGVGGTSWSAVEYHRARRDGNDLKAKLGKDFWDWGISTALSIILVVDATDLEVIATGGIRSGLDVVKSLSLGASAAGIAYPLLNSAVNGTTNDVIAELKRFIEGLRVAMYLTGCRCIDDLTSRPLIITGKLAESLKSLDIDYKKIASGS